MGCDIHWTVEVKHEGKWIGVLNSSGSKSKADDRWYTFFGELAGVRVNSDTAYSPRGIPSDVSDLTRYDMEMSSWDHTGSWLSVDEFVDAYNRAVAKYADENPDEKPVGKAELFGLSWWPMNDSEEQRVVFAFDN